MGDRPVPTKVPIDRNLFNVPQETPVQTPPVDFSKQIEFTQIDTQIKAGFGFYSFLLIANLLFGVVTFLMALPEVASAIEIILIIAKAYKINALYVARQAKNQVNLAKQRTAVQYLLHVVFIQIASFAFIIFEMVVAYQYMKDEMANLVQEEIDLSQFADQGIDLGDGGEAAVLVVDVGGAMMTGFFIIYGLITCGSMYYVYNKSKEILGLMERRRELLQQIPASQYPK